MIRKSTEKPIKYVLLPNCLCFRFSQNLNNGLPVDMHTSAFTGNLANSESLL